MDLLPAQMDDNRGGVDEEIRGKTQLNPKGYHSSLRPLHLLNWLQQAFLAIPGIKVSFPVEHIKEYFNQPYGACTEIVEQVVPLNASLFVIIVTVNGGQNPHQENSRQK
eukprot:CAMPEP_0201891306 /NCGR_PEP_ID=MMETSP0902-20130614/34127_1 /ASSEMBLY_ACC=CAM_ASM_000551 /TAXON_ID=420261 /ORGANISM="Thalassiosira antarctica, Strain CCMP982" /LENGTH=108 /DNA_ID=CAMNT_0048422451 /DNA_START=24 /DNA_END=350 /DNA_ORIENTATION=-